MKQLLCIVFFAQLMPHAFSQDTERFREGYFIDKFGQKYSGMIRLDPGDGKKPAQVTFKESKKGKRETYGPDYVKAFVVESDSFTVVKNIPIGNRKTIPIDFALVKLNGSGGVVYRVETELMKSSGHAATEYKINEEKLKYFLEINGKLLTLTANNMKDFATIIGDNADLKARVLKKKIKFDQLESAIQEYKLAKKK